MTGLVIDASVTLSWCFPDEQTPLSLDVLDRLKGGEQALVPAFWSVEVLNVLLLGERKGRIAPEQTASFFDTLRALNPRMDQRAPLHQLGGADDALYIELALRSGLPLATLDQPQRVAAKALGVRCL